MSQGQWTPNCIAGGTIRPYRFVKPSTAADNTLLECDSNDPSCGITTGSSEGFDSDNVATSGNPVYLQPGRIMLVTAGAALTAGVFVGPDDNGKAVANGNGQAITLQAAVADGDVIEVFYLGGTGSSGAGTNPSEVVTTTNVITADESGKTFYLSNANGFTSTLPAPAIGLKFKFIVKTAPTTAYIITTNGSANIMYGMMEERAGTAGVAGAARDTFNFVASQSIIGDWVEFESDGTNWYYHGMVDVAAGNTVAAT